MVRPFLVFLFLSFGVVLLVDGQTKEELELRKQKTRKEIELTNELLEKTTKERNNSLQQLSLLNKGIENTNFIIANIESESRLLDFSIGQTEQEIADLERKVEKEKDEYVRLIYSAYVSQSVDDRFMYILASDNFSQAYQRLKYLKYLSEYRRNRITEIKESIEELENRKEVLKNQKYDKEKLISEKALENRNLQKKRNEKDLLVKNLKSQETKLREEIKRKEKIRAQIEEEINKVIAEEAKKLNSSNLYNALTPEQKLISGEFKSNKGKLPWPVERGVITLGYGNTKHPILPGVVITNEGIDITSSGKTYARAVFDGEVSRVFSIIGANSAVMVRHGEYLTVYQNLVNVRVKAGDKVKTKQILGEVFSDDGTGTAVLHFTVWKEKTTMNPQEWISK